MIHYAIYKKRSNVEPDIDPPAGRIATDSQRPSGDDVFGTPDPRPSPGSYRLPMRGGSLSGRGRSSVGPLSGRAGTGPSPLSGPPRRNRRRLSDASEETSPKSPRLGQQADIAVARREIAAREADLQKKAAEVARKESNLRQQQRTQTQLRPGDIVIREERIRDLESRMQEGYVAIRRLEDINSRRQQLSGNFNSLTHQRDRLEADYWAQRSDLYNQQQQVRNALSATRQQIQNTPSFRQVIRSQLNVEAINLQTQLDQITRNESTSYENFQRDIRLINVQIEAAGVDLITLLSGLDLDAEGQRRI